MTLENFANDHIGKRGEVKNRYWEEDARVTKFVRFENDKWNVIKGVM